MFFQSAVRAVVKHFVREDDQTLFKAPPTVQKRLLPLGFSTHAAKLAFVPQLSADQQSQVAKALLALRGRFTLANAAALDEGTLRLARVPLTLRKQPMWRRQLRIVDQLTVALPPPLPPECDYRPQRRADQVTLLEATKFLDAFRLVCRACSTQRTCAHVIPRSGYTWAKLTCTNRACRKIAPANSWWCACLIPWRTCSLHSVWPSRAQAQAQLRELPRNKAKRDLSTAPPPALTVKRARTALRSSPGPSSSGVAPAASSTARTPKRVALAQLDQQIATRRILAKMPKLAAKFSHLVQTPKDAEEGCRQNTSRSP